MSEPLTPEQAQRIIKLASSDKTLFCVPRSICVMSKTLNTMLLNLGIDNTPMDTNQIPIPLENVNSKTLALIITWCNQHVNDAVPVAVDPATGRTNISAWDAEFLNVDQKVIFEILLAANYLEITGLIDVCTTRIADSIRGLSPRAIRAKFDITNDFTPLEEEQLRQENAWAEGYSGKK